MTDDTEHPHTEVDTVAFGVLTVSSSRTLETDGSGDAIADAATADGREIATRELVTDDRELIAAAVLAMVTDDAVDAVILTGGTGLSPADVTVEAIRPLCEQAIPGFGELFRYLSYEDIGPRALLSRAFAGSIDGVPVFCLPGSEQAARFGTEQLILPTVAHVIGHTQGLE